MKYKVVLPSTSPITGWLVRHAAWLITRFVEKSTGETAWSAQHLAPYAGMVVPFGEVVEAKARYHELGRAKLSNRWVTGVWLGRAAGTGVLLARPVRRRDATTAYDKTILETMKGEPWDTKGLGDDSPVVEAESGRCRTFPARCSARTPWT